MLELTQRLDEPTEPSTTLTLAFDQRQKSRFRSTTDDGADVSVVLPRGMILRDGDCLTSTDGVVVKVVAAPERLSIVTTDDALALARVAYHLGNRHVPLQIEAGRLSYGHDHVLDAMVRDLGLDVTTGDSPFHPESGAYHFHSSSGGHGHGHR